MKAIRAFCILVILIALTFISNNILAISKDSVDSKFIGSIPQIFFRENKGQIHDQKIKPRTDILYSGNVGAMAFHLKQDGLHYQLSRVDEWKEEKMPGSFDDEKIKVPAKSTIHRLDISWPGANPNAEITDEKPIKGFDNYYLPSCPDGATNVKSYQQITYKKIYEGIDLVFHNKNDELHYDFIVAPGADYTNIKIKIKGANSIKKNDNGDIIIQTPLGDILEGKPLVYQKGKQLEANWIVQKNQLSFNIQNYDPSYEMIIDPPVRNWGTYYGGAKNEGANGSSTSTDNFGNVFLFGETRSTQYIATSGAFQTTLLSPPRSSFYMVKFNSSGIRQWGTYYGGSDNENANRCTTDLNGNVYFCGRTSSSDIPTSLGAQQTVKGGSGGDAFLVKLSSSGIRLWATYYGGILPESGTDCSTDKFGNVYLSGYTSSYNFIPNIISTPGSHQPNSGGGSDAYLVKFDSSGTRLWGTFYGGSSGDYGNSCSTDSIGNIYLCGSTSSAAVAISTPGSYQPNINGASDMFIAKFNNNGVRIWGTYYGGSGSENISSCKTDLFGNLFITGTTSFSTSMSTPGAYQMNNAGGQDVFLSKFNSNGNRIWSTYFGGSQEEGIRSFCAINRFGDVFLAGTTHSYFDSISTSNAYQLNHNGGILDAFLAKFDNNGNIYWSTYYGGSSQDAGYSCSSSLDGNIYLSGYTMSTNNIATLNSHQQNLNTVPGSAIDNYLIQFCDTIPSAPVEIFGPSIVCINSRQNILYYVNSTGNTFNWNVPVGATIVSGQGSDSIRVDIGISGGNISVSAQNNCGSSIIKTFGININYIIPPVVTSTTLNTICFGDSSTLSAIGGSSYLWSTGDTSSSITISPNTSSSYTVLVSNNGCDSLSQPINITVNNTFLFSDTIAICQGDSALLYGQYQFIAGIYYDSLQTNLGCDSIYSTSLEVNPIYFINDSINICQGDSILLGGTYQTTNGLYYDTLSTINSCDSLVATELKVNITPSTPLVNDTAVCFNNGTPTLFPSNTSFGTLNWYSNSNGTGLIHFGNNYTPSINTEGLYTYYIQETRNNCKSGISSITLQVHKPNAIINPSELSGLAPLEIFFGNGSTNSTSYFWNFGTGDTSNLFSPSYTYDSEGSFVVTLTASDLNGCIDSTNITIEMDIKYIVTAPNTITPNDDDVNDFWIIDNIEHFPNHSIQVFNRNGSLVFKANDYQNNWGGQYNGNDLPATTYYYVIDLGNGDEIIKGDLSIIREK